MKWVKIEDGCEMPNKYERVVVQGGGIWFEVYIGVFGLWESEGREVFDNNLPTHWARVELPEE